MNWIYTRISTDQQSEASLDNQEMTCRKWVTDPISVIHEIESGAKGDRPLLRQMLDNLRPGDNVCIYDYSRLSRKVKDALDLLDQITEKGAYLICGGKVIDPDDPIDAFTYSIHSAMAEMQRTIQNKKAKEGIRQTYDSGNYVFCSTLFGYDLIKRGRNTTVNIIDEEAKIIKFIYDRFASGWSLKKILSNLTGISLQRQSTFTLKKLSRILKQTIYMGYYVKDKDRLSDLGQISRPELEGLLIQSKVYPPIISEDLWWTCFDRYREVTPKHSRPWQLRWTKHALSGIIRCPDCGKGIARFEHTHCYCTEDHSFDCPSKNRVKFQEDWLERIMELSFYLTFLDGSEISSFFSAKQQELFSDKTEIVQAIESIDKSIIETQTKIDRIVSAIADGIITNEQASSQMKGLKQTISDYETRRKSLESDLLSVNEDLDTFIELSAEEIIDSFSGDKKRDLYRKVIKYAYAYNDRIEIEYLNGKHYTIPRGKRHNHKVDPVTVKVSYNDNEYTYKNDEYLFVYELNKVVYNPCGVEAYDNFMLALLDRAWSLVTECDTILDR